MNTSIIDSYMIFLQTLNPDARLDIISRLTQSLKSEIKPKENLFAKSFGAWSGSESADEIVKGIKDGRTFNRQIEGLWINICWIQTFHGLAKQFERAGNENCFISEITLAELKFGVENSQAREKNIAALGNFLTGVTIIPVFPCLDIYAKEKARLRKAGQTVDDFDLLIGATAISNGLILVTNKVDHLGRMEGVKIEDWTK